MTWMEVIDSAIKIGLGALIGGLFSIYHAQNTYTKELQKLYTGRRRELLEDVVTICDTFSSDLAAFWATLSNSLHKKNRNERITDKDLESLNKLEGILYESFKNFHAAESKLLIVGETAIQEKLRDYAKLADGFFKIATIENSELTKEKLTEYGTQFREKRKELLLDIGTAYKK